MKIKNIHIEKFKRFTDLTIEGIPETAKLVVLVGPNGCGKSSLFDAFKTWHLLKGYGNGSNDDYCKKDFTDVRSACNLVRVDFHQDITKYTQNSFRGIFYFRTAYRNSPQINVKSLQQLSSPIDKVDQRMMIQNDATVDENYQRLVAKTLSNVYDKKYDNTEVKDLRDELLSKIREPLHRLFPDLLLTEIGMVTEKAEFYFSKGTTQRYGYEKLSGGEKATFDLLLDMVIKSEYYKNTVFCIDEPETHIHTKLQASLLAELYKLVPNESQLWIATHSFGMLKEAKKLLEEHPGGVVFLNFDGFDFDDVVRISPEPCANTIWNKMIEITLDDYAPFLSPQTIVFCEGSSKGKKRKDFDARCYTNIFKESHPNAMFFSLGGCNDIEQENAVIEFISKLSPSSKIVRLIDKDDRSLDEIEDLKKKAIRVLSRRHIESYLLDNSVLIKWCDAVEQSEKQAEVLSIKQEKMDASVARGNPDDDYKSASNDICTFVKKTLGVTGCGNNGESILRDTLSRFISADMEVYKELEQVIFGEYNTISISTS